MKTAEMIAKSLTSSEKDTVVKINLNQRAFHDVSMLLGHYFRYSEIPEQSPYEFVNDIGIYLLQRGFLNTLTRPVFDLKPLIAVDDDTVLFTQNTVYQGNMMVDGKMCVLLYDYDEILPKGFLSRLATPTCIIICNSFDDRALIFCQYIEEQSRTVKSMIRTNITSSEIHLIPRGDGLTAKAIATIVKLAPPQPMQFRNPNYNTGEDKSALAHLQHYARHHNIPGDRPPSIDNLLGIHPCFNPAFQPNHGDNNSYEIYRIIQQLRDDLSALTNRMNNIEAKASKGTNVADEIPPTVDEQPQPDKGINEDMLDATDAHTRTTRDIWLGSVPTFSENQLDALATEIEKISQRLEHLKNSVYNNTDLDINKPEPSLGYPSND